jgi:molybdopterin converting factor small subunit
MKIRLQFFAQLKDITGVSELELDLDQGSMVGDLLAALYQRVPTLRAWDKTILVGSGVEFVGRDHVLRPNEEIAIMPPVQGG